MTFSTLKKSLPESKKRLRSRKKPGKEPWTGSSKKRKWTECSEMKKELSTKVLHLLVNASRISKLGRLPEGIYHLLTLAPQPI